MSSEGEVGAPPELLPLRDSQEPPETRFLKWVLLGPHGVRSGWLAAGFLVVNFLMSGIYTVVIARIAGLRLEASFDAFTPATALLLEAASFLGLLTAMGLSALVERRNPLDYNLRGGRRWLQLGAGIACGVAALGLLATALAGGGWLHFDSPGSHGGLHGAAVVEFGLVWGGVFLLTGLTEEGMTRCYLLFTLSRGVALPSAAAVVAALCALAGVNGHGHGTIGVYGITVVGAVVCVVVRLRPSEEGLAEGFWPAAWLTSVFFAYLHTFNRGESDLGIFGTGLIGLAFCVSVRVLGSAWWAIGFHAAWDWTQTFLLGTADSGLAPKDHWFSSAPSGPELWSGGSAGPEGSLLTVPLIALVIGGLLIVQRAGKKPQSVSSAELGRLS